MMFFHEDINLKITEINSNISKKVPITALDPHQWILKSTDVNVTAECRFVQYGRLAYIWIGGKANLYNKIALYPWTFPNNFKLLTATGAYISANVQAVCENHNNVGRIALSSNTDGAHDINGIILCTLDISLNG